MNIDDKDRDKEEAREQAKEDWKDLGNLLTFGLFSTEGPKEDHWDHMSDTTDQ